MQGFITCTTFTNWQKSFRWDSMHESAFAYDHDVLAQQMIRGERRVDRNGTFSTELQSTIRCGDPWNEGVVWPRLAEIGLLGGLGCGKALLSLAIERLESMKPTATHNYDYVVLQATENSVPFYESMGFVRVGAVVESDKFEAKTQQPIDDDETESEDESVVEAAVATPVEDESEEEKTEIVSSPVVGYDVEEAGETPLDVAKKFDVDVWDIVFLNKDLYEGLNPRSKLKLHTSLYIPSTKATRFDASTNALTEQDLEGESSAPKWYVARENDTPKMIAKIFNLDCDPLVGANLERLPELQSISRLKEGTRIKVSRFDMHDDRHIPYSHWTFPDDTGELIEPSYMMARKLNRRQPKPQQPGSNLDSPIQKYVAPPQSLFSVVDKASEQQPQQENEKRPVPPVPPKRPLSGYMHFCLEKRPSLEETMKGKPGKEYTKVLAKEWRQISPEDQALYQQKHENEKEQYEKAMAKYKKLMETFYERYPECRTGDDDDSSTLFNKVVKLGEGAGGEAKSEFKYFFVLTYIPDLQWCHLAPMKQVGRWGEDEPQAQGRPIWTLVGEEYAAEVDISASFCVPVRSKTMKGTVDADKEKWDIFESGGEPSTASAALTRGRNHRVSMRSGPARESRSATKPLSGTVERVRKGEASWDEHKFVNGDGTVPKRKRGRPPKLRPDADDDEPPKRQRGRPPKHHPDVDYTGQTLLNFVPKRGPGRPPKRRPQFMGGVASSNEGHLIAVKRGPGRPRKHPPPEPSLYQAVSPKRRRGPGRPRKHSLPDTGPYGQNQTPKRGPGRPRKHPLPATDLGADIPTPKRGPGRPRKHPLPPTDHYAEQPIPKRGPGRPRKHPLPATDNFAEHPTPKRGPGRPPKRSLTATHHGENPTPKRGPGRPRKHPLPSPDRVAEDPTPPRRRPGRPPKKRALEDDEFVSGSPYGSRRPSAPATRERPRRSAAPTSFEPEDSPRDSPRKSKRHKVATGEERVLPNRKAKILVNADPGGSGKVSNQSNLLAQAHRARRGLSH